MELVIGVLGLLVGGWLVVAVLRLAARGILGERAAIQAWRAERREHVREHYGLPGEPLPPDDLEGKA